jgi:hypothetical protein
MDRMPAAGHAKWASYKGKTRILCLACILVIQHHDRTTRAGGTPPYGRQPPHPNAAVWRRAALDKTGDEAVTMYCAVHGAEMQLQDQREDAKARARADVAEHRARSARY